MIETDAQGYHNLPCGCRIGRLASYYCGKEHHAYAPPKEEASIIKQIEKKFTHELSQNQ